LIDVAIPVAFLWALRWALFLGPLVATLALGYRHRHDKRRLIGGLFAFLYGLGLIFVMHQLAMALGWWRYGGNVLMLMGLPADIWLGGALLFGPALYFAFPSITPLLLTLPIAVGLHGTVFSSLKPFVWAGEGWFVGVVLVFAVAHIPAIYLAKWTARNENLALRATLLAVGYGCLAFAVLPSLIIHSLGGSWSLGTRPPWLLAACAPCFVLCMVMGLSAVQFFVIEGQGTPIPLDPTQRLVRTGLFAYVTNPMQLCTALAWIVMGVALGNFWVASASIMAWVFVQGMVRWHHRNDLLIRFPEGWPEYRAHVPEWLPRWHPWVQERSQTAYDPASVAHRWIVAWLQRRQPSSLDFVATPGTQTLSYRENDMSPPFTGVAAVAKAFNRINFPFALMGATILLVVLPSRWIISLAKTRKSAAVAGHG